MNILVVSVDALPALGGVSVMSHSVASALARAGHTVVFMGPKGSYVPGGFERRYHFYEDWESEVRKRSGPDGIEQDMRVGAVCRKLLERYAIQRVLLMHPFYYAVGAIEACQDLRVPCSVYFHGYELRSQLRGSYPKNMAAIVRGKRFDTLRERTLYTVGAASEILVNSNYTAGLFKAFTVKPRVRVTGCGVDAALVAREMKASPGYDSAVRLERRAALDMPPQTCLAFVGRLVSTKRADRLLRLCRLNQGLSAVIIGSGPDEPSLRNLAREWALEDRVTFAGTVTEKRKWELLRASDFLCLLSEPDEEKGQVEGFGIALLEGAAAGAVPVSSGSGGMRDVVEDGVSGLVLPTDDAQAGALLSKVAADGVAMSNLVATARTRLRERFTWEAVARRISGGWSTS
jgi:glycosyltransferase involved in cell wall biosynthesis